MKIKLKRRNSFGHRRIYADCEKSKLLAQLINKQCFDDNKIELLKKLGYEITITQGEE